jgi:hypothetical protein
MNNEKTHHFLPLACCAVVSAVIFGGIGVAALTGQIAVSSEKGDFFSSTDSLNRHKDLAEKSVTTPIAKPTHVGLTRSAVRDAGKDDKPMVVRVSQRFSQTLTPPCSRCGVIDSIERHELQMPASRSTTGKFAFTEPRSSNKETSFPGSTLTKSNPGLYPSGTGDIAISFIVRLRMEDGSVRTIYEHQQPKFSVGEKVQLVNGSVISLS